MIQSNNWPMGSKLTLVGVFGNRQHIESALLGLSNAGYKPDVITVLQKEGTPEQESGRKINSEKSIQAYLPGFMRTVIVGTIIGGLIAGGITLLTGLWS